MLFHLGALWRLNELGYLKELKRVSSVSGGSIIAAVLGMNWSALTFDEKTGVASGFAGAVVDPIRRLAGRSLDWRAVLAGILLPGSSVSWHLSWMYDRRLFRGATLQQLPADDEGPLFVINATNLQSGVLWRFSQPYAWDYRVGQLKRPEIRLAKAVAASSAFPPVLAPARFRFKESAYTPGTGKDLQEAAYTTRPVLADGGVYDNLGLETAWKRCQTVLISDGGGAMAPAQGKLWRLSSWRWRDWGTQSVRVMSVIDNQVRALRKRQAIQGFESQPGDPHFRHGTYWGIRSNIEKYPLEKAPLDCPSERTLELAKTRTGLRKLAALRQERLINWGYAICDAAMRKHVIADPGYPAPDEFPYPEAAV